METPPDATDDQLVPADSTTDDSTTDHRVEVLSMLSDLDRAAVTALATSAAHADGASPLNEDARLRLATTSPGIRHLVVRVGSAGPVGYGQLDSHDGTGPAGVELVVDPGFRRRGIATALLRTAVRLEPVCGLRVWAHGTLPAAQALAARHGFLAVRQLLQMHRQLIGPDVAPIVVPPAPDGITVRAFVQGQDEAAWLAVNAAAFADHPEQGRWTMADLLAREREPWFDAAGFFLAARTSDDTMAGFHWTKVEAGLGEVYVVGIDPRAQGSGLGKLLLTTGLRYLADHGCDTVELYVEADNVAARQLYERQGFVVVVTDTQYRSARDIT